MSRVKHSLKPIQCGCGTAMAHWSRPQTSNFCIAPVPPKWLLCAHPAEDQTISESTVITWRIPEDEPRPHHIQKKKKKGTAKKLRACDNAAHQQYRKAGLQLRRRRIKPVHRPKRRGQPPCRSPSHLVASIGAAASSEKPICDLAARQKHDRLERAAGPCASPPG